MKYKIIFVALLIGMLIGVYMGRATVSHQTTSISKKKETSKYKDVKEVVTIRESKDGTKVTTIERDAKELEVKEIEKHKQTKIDFKPQWSTGVYLTTRQYMVMTLDRRILGPISLGVYGRVNQSFDHELGIGVRFEF